MFRTLHNCSTTSANLLASPSSVDRCSGNPKFNTSFKGNQLRYLTGFPYSNLRSVSIIKGFFYALPLHLPHPFSFIFFPFLHSFYFYFQKNYHPVLHVPGCVSTIITASCIAPIRTSYTNTMDFSTTRIRAQSTTFHIQLWLDKAQCEHYALILTLTHKLTKLPIYILKQLAQLLRLIVVSTQLSYDRQGRRASAAPIYKKQVNIQFLVYPATAPTCLPSCASTTSEKIQRSSAIKHSFIILRLRLYLIKLREELRSLFYTQNLRFQTSFLISTTKIPRKLPPFRKYKVTPKIRISL